MKLPLAYGVISSEIKTVTESQLRAVKDFKSAVRLCIAMAPVKRTQNDIAAHIGVNATQFSKVLNSGFHLPGDAITKLEKLCKNAAITQFQAAQIGATLHFETLEEKVQRLEAELAKVAA